MGGCCLWVVGVYGSWSLIVLIFIFFFRLFICVVVGCLCNDVCYLVYVLFDVWLFTCLWFVILCWCCILLVGFVMIARWACFGRGVGWFRFVEFWVD